jgi:excisionase family DNA binding protein
MQELISLAEAAVRLGVHISTLRAWVREGHVPSYRVGQRFTRVDWGELMRAIAKSSAKPEASDAAR